MKNLSLIFTLCMAALAQIAVAADPEQASGDSADKKVFYLATRGIKDARAWFVSETVLESFMGENLYVTGQVKYDPENKTGQVKIALDATKFDTGIELRNTHLQSSRWLDAETYPEIIFESTEISFLETTTRDDIPTSLTVEATRYSVSGHLTIKGIKQPLDCVVESELFPAGELTRTAGFGEGDVARFKTQFPVHLPDFGIEVEEGLSGVSPQITIHFDSFASTDPQRFRDEVTKQNGSNP
jgi:polyisoprenoid-binding protein YceI